MPIRCKHGTRAEGANQSGETFEEGKSAQNSTGNIFFLAIFTHLFTYLRWKVESCTNIQLRCGWNTKPSCELACAHRCINFQTNLTTDETNINIELKIRWRKSCTVGTHYTIVLFRNQIHVQCEAAAPPTTPTVWIQFGANIRSKSDYHCCEFVNGVDLYVFVFWHRFAQAHEIQVSMLKTLRIRNTRQGSRVFKISIWTLVVCLFRCKKHYHLENRCWQQPKAEWEYHKSIQYIKKAHLQTPDTLFTRE